MLRYLLTVSAVVCLLGAVFFLAPYSSQVPFSPVSLGSSDEPWSLASFYTAVPYTSSWGSWWHPHRQTGSGQSIIEKGWNLLYHLGGNGPWIEKIDGVVDGGLGPPEGCKVEQAHMLSRHAERFPTINAGGRMIELLERIRDSDVRLKGKLEFVNDWDYFTQEPEKHLEQLTTTGPFAGVLEAFTTGVKLRTRYGHLVNDSAQKKTSLWASDSNRVINTAQYFSAGFFGLDWQNRASLHVIPETDDLGADTLTPGDTCIKYRDDLEYGHDYGAAMLVKFRETYLGAIGDRLEKENPSIRFTDAEIYSMQEMCGFETLVRGASEWCNVFTHEDWENFEYARDVIHYYRAGPGNPYSPAMGWLWLNATANLLSSGPAAGPLFFSFVHDGDIIPMIAALRLFPSSTDLPISHVDRNRAWRTSQITPMGGRIIFERLNCVTTTTTTATAAASHETNERIYIRINVNDGIVALPGCATGPGQSCPLDEYMELVRKRGEDAGDFREVCALDSDKAGRITFLHQ